MNTQNGALLSLKALPLRADWAAFLLGPMVFGLLCAFGYAPLEWTPTDTRLAPAGHRV